jgi:hypothetical protein
VVSRIVGIVGHGFIFKLLYKMVSERPGSQGGM